MFFFQHRLVRLQNFLSCVSDVRRLLGCQRFVVIDETGLWGTINAIIPRPFRLVKLIQKF